MNPVGDTLWVKIYMDVLSMTIRKELEKTNKTFGSFKNILYIRLVIEMITQITHKWQF